MIPLVCGSFPKKSIELNLLNYLAIFIHPKPNPLEAYTELPNPLTLPTKFTQVLEQNQPR